MPAGGGGSQTVPIGLAPLPPPSASLRRRDLPPCGGTDPSKSAQLEVSGSTAREHPDGGDPSGAQLPSAAASSGFSRMSISSRSLPAPIASASARARFSSVEASWSRASKHRPAPMRALVTQNR